MLLRVGREASARRTARHPRHTGRIAEVETSAAALALEPLEHLSLSMFAAPNRLRIGVRFHGAFSVLRVTAVAHES
jgi:hypothetical protein